MPLLFRASALGASSVVLFTGYRFYQMEVERASLDREYTGITNRMEALHRDRMKGMQEVVSKEKWRRNKEETLDIMWKDRLERFHDKIKELKDYIAAMPESLSVLQGLVNHYHYMATALKDFLAFDVAAATTHNMGLLLVPDYLSHFSSSSTDTSLHPNSEDGLRAVCGTMRQLLPQDDFLDAVCTSVENIKSIEVPKSIEEISRAFQFCMEQLEQAKKRALEHQIVRSSSFEGRSPLSASPLSYTKRQNNVTSSSDNCAANSFLSVPKKSMFLETIHTLFGTLKISVDNNANNCVHASRKADKEEERASLEHFFQREVYHLRTHEDIMAAMAYVESFQSKVHNTPKITEKSEGTHGDNVLHFLKRSPFLSGGKVQSSDEKDVLASIQNNHGVQLALQHAVLWKNVAATFLLEEQAKVALLSYHTLMTERLTRQGIAP